MIAAAFDLDERTVSAWQHRAEHQSQRVHEATIQPLELQQVQADEMGIKLRAAYPYVPHHAYRKFDEEATERLRQLADVFQLACPATNRARHPADGCAFQPCPQRRAEIQAVEGRATHPLAHNVKGEASNAAHERASGCMDHQRNQRHDLTTRICPIDGVAMHVAVAVEGLRQGD
jgi:hypothetical protein